MIIPMKPENVRITIQLTSADFETGAFTHDIDLQKLYDNRNSCAYEFVLDDGGLQISNDYQLFYDDGTLYATVFFPTNDGQMLKLTLTEGEGVISETEPELPAVTSSENGQVLKVVNGAWTAADAPSGLPAVTGADNGKVLTVSSGAWAAANPTGISEYQAQSIAETAISNLMSTGYSENLVDVDDEDGCTITTPGSDTTGLVATGHIFIRSSSEMYSSDFSYEGASNGFVFKETFSGSEFTCSKIGTISPSVKTGAYIQDDSSNNFDVYVIWYYNPDRCTIEEGQYTPGGGA